MGWSVIFWGKWAAVLFSETSRVVSNNYPNFNDKSAAQMEVKYGVEKKIIHLLEFIFNIKYEIQDLKQ